MWESLQATPPPLPLDCPWAGVISYNPGVDFHAVTCHRELPEGTVPIPIRMGLQSILVLQELSRGSLQHLLTLSCFAIISFAVIRDMFAQITLSSGQHKMLPALAK